MPRIINAYADNSALGSTLKDLGEAVYGDQAKNEVYRQTAFGKKNINDLAIDPSVGLDDPRLAKAQLAIGGNASGTFAGQGRALANDRWTTSATIAGNERNNIRNNAETHYSTDRRYQSDIDTTGMNNATSIRVGEGNNNASRDVARIQADKQAQSDRYKFDNTYETAVEPNTGQLIYVRRSDAAGREAPPSVDQVKAGVIAQALRRTTGAQQPQGFPVNGTTSWDASAAPAPQPARPQGGDIFAGMTPQVRALVGVNSETPMVDPRSGQTGLSRDNGTTLENGQPATGYLPVSPEARLAQEKDNNVKTQAAAPLPSAPTGYPDVAKDAALTSGPKSFAQKELNDLSGTFGLGEAFPGVNRARESLANQAQATRELIANAPGRAAVMDKKWADELIPQPGWFGVTGINATEQANRSVSLTNHLRQMYTMVQQDATDPNTPPAERVKMAAYLRNLGNVIQMREKVTPEAGAAAPAAQAAPPQAAVAAPAAAPTAGASAPGARLPTLTPEQAAAAPPGTRFLTVDGQERVRH